MTPQLCSDAIAGRSIDRKERAEVREKEGRGLRRGRGAEVDGEVTVGGEEGGSAAGWYSKLLLR